MSARAHGDPNPPMQSPYAPEFADYQGNIIKITIVFDNATRALLSADAYRDDACIYRKIYLGKGVDGSPDSTPHVLNVASGTRHLNTQQLINVLGFTTIEQVLDVQITAGP
jgi:hypothetical protein